MLQVIQFLAVIDPNDYLFTAADTGKNPCLWLLMQAFMLHIMKFVFKFFFFWKETHKGFHFQKKKVYTQRQGYSASKLLFLFPCAK